MIRSKTVTLWVCGAALLGLAACNKTTNEPSRSSSSGGATSVAPSGSAAKAADKALVRFINATPSPKQLTFGDTTAFSNVAAKAAMEYIELPAERHEFKLYDANQPTSGEPLASNSEGLTAGQHYTVLATTGENHKAILEPISDDLAQPDPGKAKIRVIHAAPGVKKVDVYVAGTDKALVDGVGFKSATGYKEVDPVATEIDLRTTGSKNNAERIGNLSLAAGRMYTLVVMGGNGQPLSSTVIEDRLEPARTSSR